MKRQLSLWRLLAGLLLVYINGKFLLFLQTRSLQPANHFGVNCFTCLENIDLGQIAGGLAHPFETPETSSAPPLRFSKGGLPAERDGADQQSVEQVATGSG